MSLVTFDNLKRFFEGLKTKPLVFSGDISFNGTTKYKNKELATKADILTKTSQLTNDSNYITKTVGDNTYLNKSAIASSANKLNTNAGSELNPVYFANGVPVKTTYTLNASVPAGAKFTDTNTTYSPGTGISLSGTTFSNSGVRSVVTGSTNGTISVNTNGTANNVAVKGLASGAYTDISTYAKKTDIPTKISQLINDSGYATKTNVDTAINTKTSSYLPLTGGTITGAINLVKSAYTLKSDENGALSWSGTSFTAPKVYNAVYNDYAEYFPKGEETEPGDIISLDFSSDTERYVKADNIKNTAVVGVHSDSYGHLIGGDNPPASFTGSFEDYNNVRYIPIALCGRVMVKVKGIVHKGEYIVASDISGVGKAEESSKLSTNHPVGIALENKLTEGISKIKIKII